VRAGHVASFSLCFGRRNSGATDAASGEARSRFGFPLAGKKILPNIG